MSIQRGFTLLELLIGMTLLGFILALLFGGFRLASNSWDAVNMRVEETADNQLGRSFLRRVLSQIQPVRWPKGLNQPIAYSGDAKHLTAIAPLTMQSGGGGLRAIELSFEPGDKNDGPYRLVLRQAPVDYEAERFFDALADTESRVILTGIVDGSFSYFGPEKRGDPPQWTDAWTNPEQIPQLIDVRLRAKDPGWGSVVAAPMLGDSSCNWDSLNRRCR
jgi:general secretion pathway protein J